MTELDYLLRMTPEGVSVLEGDAAALNDVAEWLDTPRGIVFGRPDWGNNLDTYRHEPTNEALEVAIENSIMLGLMRDVPAVQIKGIRCEASKERIDEYLLYINTSAGLLSALFGLDKGVISGVN